MRTCYGKGCGEKFWVFCLRRNEHAASTIRADPTLPFPRGFPSQMSPRKRHLDTAYETLQRLSEQIALLERQLVASQQVESAARSHQTVMQSAISEVNPDMLWTLDDTTINHILHRFFDPIRIECIDGEPIRFVSK